jgi:uncharacterized oligopeptide transporter (OPT) family protein
MDSPLGYLLMALVVLDGVQVPLVLAIFASFRLSRRFGSAWKGVGVASGAYVAWVVLFGLSVGYSVSTFLLIALGSVIDPAVSLWHVNSSDPRPAWRAMGSGVVAIVAILWVLPTGIAWLLRRKSLPAKAVASAPAS